MKAQLEAGYDLKRLDRPKTIKILKSKLPTSLLSAYYIELLAL